MIYKKFWVIAVISCVILFLVGCGSDQNGQTAKQKERFQKVSAIWAEAEGPDAVQDANGKLVKIVTAPEGQSFFIFYVPDSLNGSYFAKDHMYKLVGDNGYEQEGPGTRLQSECSTDSVEADGTPTGGPFAIFNQTIQARADNVQCLSLIFLLPNEVTSGKIIKQREGTNASDIYWEFDLAESGASE